MGKKLIDENWMDTFNRVHNPWMYTDEKKKTKKKTRVRRYRKIGGKISFAKYRVEWFDIASDSGWASAHQFDEMELATPVSEGWLYDKDECVVKLFASYDKDEDGMVFGERTVIPISCIKKMKKIK